MSIQLVTKQMFDNHLIDYTAHNGFAGKLLEIPANLDDIDQLTIPGVYHGVFDKTIMNEPIDLGNALRRVTIIVQKPPISTVNYIQIIRYDHGAHEGNVYFRLVGFEWFRIITNNLIKTGVGSPEGVVIASIGTIYIRTDGGTNTTFYIKESGTGNTGWVAK